MEERRLERGWREIDPPRGLDSIVVNPRYFSLLSEFVGVNVYIGERPVHHPDEGNSICFTEYESLGVWGADGREVYRICKVLWCDEEE